MRLLLAVLCAALLGGCTGGRKSYPDDVSPKNVSVRPALAGVKGALHIHRMDAQCKTEYLGTVDLDQPSVALGLPAWQLVVFYPAAAGNFFLPTYGTLLAAVSFDQTGSTRIGRYLLNHSFMRPGIVTMVAAILIAWALSAIVPL